MKQSFFKIVSLFFIGAMTVFSSCSNEPEKSTTETSAPETNAAVSTFSLDSVRASISASNKLYGECFATGDSAKFINSYTGDACIYVTNMPKMCGPQAITAFFNGAFKMGIRNLKLTTDEVTGGKEAVVETGGYELFADKNQLLDKGKYIVIWKEENGQWKMHRDIWNSDTPLAEATK